MPFLAAAMRFLVPALAALLRSKLGYFIAAALLWLGIGLTSYTVALGPAIALMVSFGQDLASGTGSGGGTAIALAAAKWAGVMRLDQAITMWVSAIYTRHAVTSARLFLTRVPGGG